MIAGPFEAMTGLSRQNTPIGDNFRIISIHFINTSFKSLHAVMIRVFFSSPTRIIAKPINNAITITCSIFASAIGEMKLDGKIFTIVSIKDVFSPTW